MLQIKNLSFKKNQKQILQNLNCEFKQNSLSLIRGKNGSGKTSLAKIIMGQSDYRDFDGEMIWKKSKENLNLKKLGSRERSLFGIFVSAQNPVEIQGLSIINFFKEALRARNKYWKKGLISTREILQKVKSAQIKLNLNPAFYNRDLNYSLSGGEKKKLELLQILVFDPEIIVLDEIDSGLDVFSQKNLWNLIQDFKKTEKIVIVISHNPEIEKVLKFDQVLEMEKGRLRKSIVKFI